MRRCEIFLLLTNANHQHQNPNSKPSGQKLLNQHGKKWGG